MQTLHLMFNKLEHTTPLRYLLVVCATLPLVPCYILRATPISLSLGTSYLATYATLAVSVLCYRLSPLHDLWKYPGPILARCSKFYGLWQQHSGEMYLKVQAMHDRYGDVVRTGKSSPLSPDLLLIFSAGPNELTIRNVSALQPLLGIDGMAKGPRTYSFTSTVPTSPHMRLPLYRSQSGTDVVRPTRPHAR